MTEKTKIQNFTAIVDDTGRARIIFKSCELPVRKGITPADFPIPRRAKGQVMKYNFDPLQGGARSFVHVTTRDEEDYLKDNQIA